MGIAAAADQPELDRIAGGYDTFADFDGVLARYAARLIAPRVAGRRVLECGAASGVMTGPLRRAARELEVVEAAAPYVARLRQMFGPGLVLHHQMLEDFACAAPFDTVVMAGLVHHLAEPEQVLRRARGWLRPGGELLLTVPNMLSFHRRLGAARGDADSAYAESERNRRFRQPGRFDAESLTSLLARAGWRVESVAGFFLKPLPHAAMERRNLSTAVLDGLDELGRRHPDLACQIFVRATAADAPACPRAPESAAAPPAPAPGGDLFTSPDWVDAIADAYGFPVHIAGRPGGPTLPVCGIDDPAGRRLVAMPFSDYVAPDMDAASIRAAFDGLANEFPDHGQFVTLASADPAPWRAEGWTIAAESFLHTVAVTGIDDMRRRLSVAFRNQLRQAERAGVTIARSGTPAALDRFVELHTLVRNEKFASLPQPRAFFNALARRFFRPGNGFVLEASAAGNLLASCVVLRCDATLYYKFSASTAAGRAVRANNAMLWALLRFATAEDCTCVDLGRSGLGVAYGGLRHFKEGLGAVAKPLVRCHRPARNADPAAAASAWFRGVVADEARGFAQSAPRTSANEPMAALLYRYFA